MKPGDAKSLTRSAPATIIMNRALEPELAPSDFVAAFVVCDVLGVPESYSAATDHRGTWSQSRFFRRSLASCPGMEGPVRDA
jgi:hypothetical protein